MASAASRAAMRSSDFQTAAVGMGFSLSCGVLLVVMSLVLPFAEGVPGRDVGLRPAPLLRCRRPSLQATNNLFCIVLSVVIKFNSV
uniref:Uncharacterized protein n=1 Tax=Oryza meridionalis TaxID=40149 RepID=A0A0E0C0B9_9ORYZ